MSKKRNKKEPNPVYARGIEVGIAKTNRYYLEAIKEFSETKGVGFITVMKLIDLMGRNTFYEWVMINAPNKWLLEEGYDLEEAKIIREKFKGKEIK